MFKLLSKGDQLKLKLINLKFLKINNWGSCLFRGGFSNRENGLLASLPQTNSSMWKTHQKSRVMSGYHPLELGIPDKHSIFSPDS